MFTVIILFRGLYSFYFPSLGGFNHCNNVISGIIIPENILFRGLYSPNSCFFGNWVMVKLKRYI